jgi:hypothetical protein
MALELMIQLSTRTMIQKYTRTNFIDASYPVYYTEAFPRFNPLLQKALLHQTDIGEITNYLESLAQVDPTL